MWNLRAFYERLNLQFGLRHKNSREIMLTMLLAWAQLITLLELWLRMQLQVDVGILKYLT